MGGGGWGVSTCVSACVPRARTLRSPAGQDFAPYQYYDYYYNLARSSFRILLQVINNTIQSSSLFISS